MKTIVCRLDLGQTRVSGYTLYDEITCEFQETTPREVKELIKRNQVNGLKLVNGDIELDTEGFNQMNLIVKSAVGKYRNLYPADTMVNCTYAVVRVIETNNGRIYETVNNRCARVKITPERLKMLIEIKGYVAGVRLVEGKIEICKGVSILDKRANNEQTDDQSYHAVPEVEQLLEGTPVVTELVSFEADNNNLRCEQSLTDVNTEENKEDDPSKEQVDEQKKVCERKTKKNKK